MDSANNGNEIYAIGCKYNTINVMSFISDPIMVLSLPVNT